MTEGKLFVVQMDSPRLLLTDLEGKTRRSKPPRRLEYRWLCNDCSRYLTIAFERGRGTITVPLLDVTVKKPAAAVLRPVEWSRGPLGASGERTQP